MKWLIYSHPHDYPRHFVARRIDTSSSSPIGLIKADDLESLRNIFRVQGLACLQRSERDEQQDRSFVETWL